MSDNLEKPSNPRMRNLDGVYASEARLEDFASLRDHFAGQVIMGIYSASKERADMDKPKAWAELAYEIADAMLIERSKTK